MPAIRILTIAFLAVLLLLTSGAAQEQVIKGRCVAITDGDTIKVLTTDQQLLRIRLAFIDAPEMHQDFGYRAKQAMSALVFYKDVELRQHAIDRYGRTVAIVFVGGIDTGLAMLTTGLAWPYYKYLTEAPLAIQDSYQNAADRAKAGHLGLWVDPDPVPPWEFRRAAKEGSTQ